MTPCGWGLLLSREWLQWREGDACVTDTPPLSC
jgi:hypothetical protein